MSNEVTSWSANKYRAAAKKHYEVCCYLLKSKADKASPRGAIISDLYYLGGYVVECTLKYIYLVNIGPANKEYSKSELQRFNLWRHELPCLYEEAKDKADNIGFSWISLKKQIKDWSEQMRYNEPIQRNEYKSITDNFWTDVETIYNSMRDNY